MRNVAIIYGTEEYLINEARRRFLEAYGGADEVQVFHKDSPPARVVEAFEGTSLFGGATLVMWLDCPYLPINRGGRSRSKLTKDEEWFLSKVQEMDEETGLLFLTKGKMDDKCAFFKALKKMADVTKCDDVTEKTIMPYVTDFLKARGLTLTASGNAYLRALFQTWDQIPLMYVFSELTKLTITLERKKRIGEGDLQDLFSGTMEKNLFTFMDEFLARNGEKVVPFLEGLFARQDSFLKNAGFMASRLRLLLAYKELKAANMGQHQLEAIMTKINKGRSVKYVLYHLQKVAAYWKIEELKACITELFILQRNIRRGTAAVSDMAPLVCLYCQHKGRV